MRGYPWLLLGMMLLSACQQEMTDQPRYEVYEAAPGWPNNQSARQPVTGTVARGDNLEPTPKKLPMPLTRALLEWGKERYEIYCSPCHGLTGHGDGMVVQRGFPTPPSLHGPYLRTIPLLHFYNIITHGFGRMSAYNARVTPDERWAIAAYIRALQLSQNGTPDDLTPEQRAKLEEGS